MNILALKSFEKDLSFDKLIHLEKYVLNESPAFFIKWFGYGKLLSHLEDAPNYWWRNKPDSWLTGWKHIKNKDHHIIGPAWWSLFEEENPKTESNKHIFENIADILKKKYKDVDNSMNINVLLHEDFKNVWSPTSLDRIAGDLITTNIGWRSLLLKDTNIKWLVSRAVWWALEHNNLNTINIPFDLFKSKDDHYLALYLINLLNNKKPTNDLWETHAYWSYQIRDFETFRTWLHDGNTPDMCNPNALFQDMDGLF